MRYIDADALIKKMFPLGIGDGKYTINAKAVKLAIDNAPTADVVPKSEVERWRRNLEAVLEERAETRAEVAMEIFEEIEQWFNTRIDFYEKMKFRASLGFDKEQYEYAKTFIANLKIYRAEIAERKKKYTEASDEKA